MPIAKPVAFTSRIDQILNVNLDRFFKKTTHYLLTGGTGSGKTSLLLGLAHLALQNKETIIWRNDGSFEYMVLAEFEQKKLELGYRLDKATMEEMFLHPIPSQPTKVGYKIRVFVPTGCSVKMTHPNIEFKEYDPTDLTLNCIFNNLLYHGINVIEYDVFTTAEQLHLFVKFWSGFFLNIYKWKRTHTGPHIAFFTDEINDIAPSRGKTQIRQQTQLSSNITFGLKKYRKENIRLVASTHGFSDIHKPLRNGFNYYLCKRSPGQDVPDWMWSYSHLFAKLATDECIIIDENHNFNRINVKEFIKPRKFSFQVSGQVYEVISAKKREELEIKNEKIALLADALHKMGATYDDIAKLTGLTVTGISSLIKRKGKSDSVKEFLDKINKKNELEELPAY